MRRKGDGAGEPAAPFDEQDERAWPAERLRRLRASGLVRMLLYAWQDSTDIGSEGAAAAIGEAIERLKAEFDLGDGDILPSRPANIN
jgi:hypothetical protein